MNAIASQLRAAVHEASNLSCSTSDFAHCCSLHAQMSVQSEMYLAVRAATASPAPRKAASSSMDSSSHLHVGGNIPSQNLLR